MGLRIERVVTSGIFSLDGEDFEVENNIWLYGDDEDVIVIDAAHDFTPIAAAVADRRVAAIVCTHGHNDHINAAAGLAARTHGPIVIHEADRMLWDVVYPGRAPDHLLTAGRTMQVAGSQLAVRHTPGHSPGGVCLVTPPAFDGTRGKPIHVFGGDTLFNGGPGATGRSFSDKATLVESIKRELMTLPDDTIIHPGHGDDTTVGAERAGIEAL